MSNEIGKLEVLLEAQTASFTKGMDSAIKQIQKLDESVKSNGQTMNQVSAQFKSVGQAATVMAQAFALIGGAGAVKSLIDQADAASDLADAFGLAISQVYAYQTVILAAGGKTDGFDKLMQKVASNVNDAFNGVKTARDGFDQLGISLKSIQDKDLGSIFDLIAVQLAKIEDPAKRNAVAIDILGKSAIGVDWAKYADNIDQTKKNYEALEGPLQRAADASDALTLAMKKFGTYATATLGGIPDMIRKVGQGFQDLYAVITGKMTIDEAMKNTGEQIEKTDNKVQSFKRNIEALQGVSDPFTTWKEGLAKSVVEAELFTKKMDYLDQQMKKATTAEQIKVIQTEVEKLNGKDPFEAWKDSVDKTSQAYSMIIPQLEYLAELRNLDMMSLEEYIKNVEQLGFTTKQTTDETTKLADSIAQSIGQNANNSVNNFIDTIGTAKFVFSDFAASVVKDLAKVMMQMLIMQPLIKSLGAYFGGTPVPTAGGKSMDGGSTYSLAPVSSDYSRALGGEATATVMGASLAAITKANLSNQVKAIGNLASSYQARPQSSSSSDSPLVVNISNTMGSEAKVTASESTNADGVKTLQIMIEKTTKEMFGSGQMDKTMRSAYGLSRAPV